MTSNHTESSHVQIQQSNGIGRPSWRAGSVHVDIDAFDVSMDIGHRQAKIGSSSNVRSATGKADLRQRSAVPIDSKEFVYSTIQPFTRPPQTLIGRILAELKGVLGRSTDSMALTAYSSLLLFDLLSLCTCLVTIWVTRQKPSSAYSFGYERFEVLAVFTSTMLASFSAIFIIKECTERIFSQPDIHTGRLMLGAALGLFCHMVVTYGNRNSALNHVSTSSKSSWLQEHFADICKSFCTVVPGLDHLLLPRINPFALVGFGGATALTLADFLIDVNNYHAADTWASYGIAFMLIGTMFPLSVYSGTILLQTTPAYILGQLDKCLREASTLDGVLEFRNEHFWTLSYGTLAGSLHVRVRRDADEQLVLAHVTNKLSHLVSPLTIQIIKDDWTRVSAMSSFSSGHLDPKVAPPAPYLANTPL
ncbi:putative zinc transporter 6 [Apostichopus japonicus]|uniref:Putative zinc transporter 6 n=1 Tax=Stichopus japonicus TaxID=307972 RepID=A0A2G8LPX7_STIJA|nr:putative zinc transporter 6 [Apostichopus japonicus]